MAVKTICPTCRITAEHPDHLRGYQAGCPFCGSPMVVGLTPLPSAGTGNPWGQLSLRRQSRVLPIVLLAAAGVMLLMVLVVGAGVALTFALRSLPRLPAAPPPVAERQTPNVPTPTPAASSPARQRETPVPAAAGEMIAELSEGKTWTELGNRSFSVNYRMLKGRPGPGSLLHWVVESADGQRSARQLMFHEIQESGTLAGRLVFARGDGPYTTYLEVGSSPLRPGTRVTEQLALEETAVESRLPSSPPNIATISPPRTNPYTAQLERLRKQLESLQQQKAAYEQRMQNFGGRAPPNPFERREQDLQRQIEQTERLSQQWEQQNAASGGVR